MTADKIVHAKYPEQMYIWNSEKGKSLPDRHDKRRGEIETQVLILNPGGEKTYNSWLSHIFYIFKIRYSDSQSTIRIEFTTA
jgi:hypothetical protein